MEFAYASPLDRAQISLLDLNGKVLRPGVTRVYIPDGSGSPPDIPNNIGVRYIATLPETPTPAWDLFELIRDSACSPYHTANPTYSYVAGNQTVVESNNCMPIPIDDLLEAKRQEILQQDEIVRYSTAATGLNASWWIVINRSARSELDTIAGALAARTREVQTGARDTANWYPGGSNQPRIAIYKPATGTIRREPPTELQYLQLAEEVGLHSNQTGNATHAATDQAETLHAANDWAGLAALDPADPQWGYPPYEPLPLP